MKNQHIYLKNPQESCQRTFNKIMEILFRKIRLIFVPDNHFIKQANEDKL